MKKSMMFLLTVVLLLSSAGTSVSAASPFTYLLEPTYDSIHERSGDFVIVRESGKYGVIKISGETILPCQYTHLSFREDQTSGALYFVAGKHDGALGLYDTAGKALTQSIYSNIIGRNGCAEVIIRHGDKDDHSGDKRAIISLPDGKPILPLTTCTGIAFIKDAGFALYFDSHAPIKYYDRDGNFLFTRGDPIKDGFTAHELTPFHTIVVKKTDSETFGVCDFSGKEILPAVYESINDDSRWDQQSYLVQRGGLWGMCGLDGTVKMNTEYDDWLPVWRKQIADSSASEYLSADGQSLGVWDRLQSSYWKTTDLYLVEKDGKWGLIDSVGSIKVPAVYGSYDNIEEVYLLFYYNDLNSAANAEQEMCIMYNTETGQVFQSGSNAKLYRSGPILYCLDDEHILRYFYNREGLKRNVAANFDMDRISGLSDHYMIVDQRSLYSTDGKLLSGGFNQIQILPPVFSYSFESDPIILSVEKNGRWGLIQLPSYVDAPSDWAVEEIAKASKLGIVPPELKGVWQGNCTREDFCAYLIKTLEAIRDTPINEILKEYPESKKIAFTDCQSENVLAAAQLAIVKGVGNGKFAPYDSISRQDAAVMLSNLAHFLNLSPNSQPFPFCDENQIAGYAKTAVQQINSMAIQDTRIMHGVGNDAFGPEQTYTREQSVLTLYRIYQYAQ